MKFASSFETIGSRLRTRAILFGSILLCTFAGTLRAQTPVVQINAGGGAVSPFIADTDFNAGNQFSSANTINTSGVTNPAPAAVYQSVRWNTSFTYTIPNLTAGSSYVVRLHFVELTWTAAGQRLFNVAINGTNVLSNFDIFAQVGQNHALVEQFNATANSSGQIVIAFTQGAADNPSVAGIEVDTPATTTRAPYGGSNWSVSNGAKIEAENYDLGGEGVAYHDTDATNQGGQYRTDGVDIETTADTGGGYDVGWINDGEWLDYTTNTTAGTYNIVVRAASNASPASGSVKVLLDGVVLGQVSIPNTGGWQTWQDLTIPNIAIAAGTGRTLQLQFVGGGFNVNYIRFATVTSSRSPYGGSNWSVANGAKIEAENYDLGGEGVAYHDADTANQGGQYRTDGVDIEACSDTGGGYDVGWINDGEWLDYTVNTTAGTYNIVLRGASNNNPNGGSVKVLLDGAVLGQVSIPYTGGWQTWQDFTIPNISIAAGTGRTLQLAFVGGGFNVNYVRFATSGGTVPSTPTGLSATGNNGSVSLTWTASSGATSYNVYRSTTSGGEGTTAYATSATNSYTDTGVSNGTTYYYTVAAVNSVGTSAQSAQAQATPSGGSGGSPNTPVIQINAGGGAVSPFVADTDFDVGNQFSSTASINTSGVSNAAPAAVYQSVRWNTSFNYTIGGLTANASYVVRLHFVELTWTASGQRKFNVAINGTTVLSGFDVFAQVGQNHALVEQFNATANSSGQIVIAFSQGGADNPDVAGIEVWTPPQLPATPSNLAATSGNGNVSLTWAASIGASSYNVYRGTASNAEGSSPFASNIGTTNYTDATVATGTTYYYKVAAVNSAGVSGLSNEASAAPLPQASAPTFSPGGGTYSSAQSVTISDSTSGASIRYTTDGSTPTSSTGNVYSGPVTISSTTTLKAIAYASGFTDSAVSSTSYTIQGSTSSGDVVGKITVGYQGWFACIGDGSPINAWWHWSQDWSQAPSPSNNVLKGWPDMREYTRGYQTGYANLGNGSQATLYSDYDQQTTNTHFLWMSQYGNYTAALQRFDPNSSEGGIRDAVASEVRTAAETYGVKFYIMYDATGWTNMASEMPADWTNKMSALTASPMYARQNGKPVVGIWGFGFNDANHPWDATTCLNVINWFKSQGCYVMGGVPREWLSGTGGSRSGFIDVYHAFNMISPWMVGAISNNADSDNIYTTYTVPDLADCTSHGIDYQPCVLPGDLSARQRVHGDFMWHQFYNMCRAGVKSIYISMFDEFGEGNQICKTAENASMEPTNSGLLTLDEDGTPCSSDYYMRLTNDGQKMMTGQISLTSTRPTPTQ